MLRVIISNEWQRQELDHESGPLHLGRQPEEDVARLVINDPYVSRRQLRIESGSGNRVLIENLSHVPVSLEDGGAIQQGQPRAVPLPCRLSVGMTSIELFSSEEDPAELLQTIAPPKRQEQQALGALGDSPSPAVLAKWFEGLLAVQKSAAGSSEFYDEAAQAVVDLIGLDRGMVLLLRNERWQVVARHPHEEQSSNTPPFSRHVLRRLRADRRTYFESYDGGGPSDSLAGVHAVVASPVLDDDEQVIGAVYGVRESATPRDAQGIQPLEAQVVQLLAGAVSAGLARIEREAEAVRTRVQFEQFFSPDLVRELERNPDLLEGQERRVTLLFSDLRSYSRISEKLGARDSYRLLSDVMDALTNRIVDHGGVIVDYHGDGLAAMWNAPANDGHHSRRACRAGMAMLEDLPTLSETWAERVGAPIRIGVGINTGMAQVGNAGSRRILKYGPLGHTVNLASRIEGATKQLGVPLLITANTRDELEEGFATRRLCQIRAVGLTEPVAIFECRATPVDDAWAARRDRYEQALASYEAGDWDQAARTLASLLAEGGEPDRPAEILSDLIERARRDRPDPFDPVFTLSSK